MNIVKGSQNTMDPLDLGRLFGLMLDHKWLILFITFVFAVGGAAYAVLATPIYQGDALVQVERRSSVSPLGDLANVMGETVTKPENSTAAEVQILQSRMVLGQVVERTGIDTAVVPKRLPVVGNYVQRNNIQRPPFAQTDVNLAGWIPDRIELPEFLRSSSSTPAVMKGGLSVPESFRNWFSLTDFLSTRSAVWGGESLRLGRFEVEDHLRGIPLVVRALQGGTYSLTLMEDKPRPLGEGTVGEL